MFKKIFLGFVVVLVLGAGILSIVIAMQPAEYSVQRQATIAAPPAEVFAHVNDFHKWDAWSPWAKADPAAKNTFEGPTEGTGAILKWSGNSEVGEGMMTITESRPHELIRIKLEFFKPFAGTATTEFTFKGEGDQTAVTWNMHGKNEFIGKAMCLVMNMDKMIGDKYVEGLANLKSISEAPAKK